MTVQTDRKYIYKFGDGYAEGSRDQTDLLGGKGANLNEMSSIGLPVPPGYTITTEACHYFVDHDGEWPSGMEEQVLSGIQHIEEAMDRRFGDPDNPLLVSVRSGAAKSMPGMMDSVLNLGLNDEVAEGFARRMGNERLAYDAYRRFIDMFGDVVVGIDRTRFENAISRMKERRGVETMSIFRPRTCGSWWTDTRPSTARKRAVCFPTIRTSNSNSPSTRSSARGRTSAPSATERSTISPASGARP